MARQRGERMSNRRRAVVLVGFAVIGSISICILLLWQTVVGGFLTTTDARKITIDMSNDQVVGIFGRPPDFSKESMGFSMCVWNVSDGEIVIGIDANKRVSYCNCKKTNRLVLFFERLRKKCWW